MTPHNSDVSHAAKTCKRGHIYAAEELQCPTCKEVVGSLWRENNRAHLLAYGKKKYRENRESRIKKAVEWRERNYEHWYRKEQERIALDWERVSAVQMENRRKNRERSIWSGMIQRCTYPKHNCYHRYGGRGIAVCDRWTGENGLENFLLDMGPRPSVHHSIDRRDNDGNYEPDNCFWATRGQQARNTSRNRFLEFNGKRQCMADWAKDLGITNSLLWSRLKRGWPIDRLLTTGPYIHT